MTQDKLNALRSIAGKQETNMPSIGNIVSQQQITANKTFLAQTVGVEPKERWNAWNHEVATGWDFYPDNNEEYWSTFKKLYPGNAEDADGFMRSEVIGSLENKSPEEQEIIFRENFRKWPAELYEELEEKFMGLKTMNDTKQIERSIVLHRLELNNALRDLNYDLDPQIPVEVHVTEWLELYKKGHLEDIKVDDRGRLGFPSQGGLELAYVGNEGTDDMGAEEQLVYAKYLKPLVRTKMEGLIKSSRERLKKEEEDVVSLLASDLVNPTILDEHKTNIIIEKAKTSNTGVSDTLEMIADVTAAKEYRGGFLNAEEAMGYYVKQYNNVVDNVRRRAENG